jgi:hypothetical protein
VWAPIPAGAIPIGADREVPVRWSSPDLHPFLARSLKGNKINIAFTDIDKPTRTVREIVLCASMYEREYPRALFHEVLHCSLDRSNRRRMAVWNYEEQALEKLDEILFRACWSMGWRPLPLPDGLDALRRHARKVRASLLQRGNE